MYVRPAFRGMGLGRRLVDQLIQAARESGYGLMRLETTKAADAAVSLYRAVGFRPCEPSYTIRDAFREAAIFMELSLIYSDSERTASR